MTKPKDLLTDKCPLCHRILGDLEGTSKHHLIPKSKGGKHTDTVVLHRVCHRKIHSVFTERELKQAYSTIELLLEHEEIAKFVKWVRKKPPEFYERSRQLKRK